MKKKLTTKIPASEINPSDLRAQPHIKRVNAAGPLIFLALVAIHQEIEAIAKKQRNESQSFNFRGIDDFYDALHPLFAKNGVITIPFVRDANVGFFLNSKGNVCHKSLITVGYQFVASDGSSTEATTIGEGHDFGDKATAKALSAAHKYLLIQTFLVPIKDIIDQDASSPNIDAAAELRSLRIEELRERLAELKRSFDGGNATKDEFDTFIKAKTALESELYAKTTAADAPKPGTPVEPAKDKPKQETKKEAAKPANVAQKPAPEAETPKEEKNAPQGQQTQSKASPGSSLGYILKTCKVASYQDKPLKEIGVEGLNKLKVKWLDINQDRLVDNPDFKQDSDNILAALAELSK